MSSVAFVAIVAPIVRTLDALPPKERAAVLDALHGAYRLGKSRAYTLAGMHHLNASECATLASDHAHLARVVAS